MTVKKGTWFLKEKLPQSPAEDEDEDSVRTLDPDAKVTAATKVKRFRAISTAPSTKRTSSPNHGPHLSLSRFRSSLSLLRNSSADCNAKLHGSSYSIEMWPFGEGFGSDERGVRTLSMIQASRSDKILGV